MIENLKERYTEIIFYCTLNSLFRTHPDIEWILNFTESLCMMYNLNSLIIGGAVRILFKEDSRPYKGEIAVVLYYSGVPIRQVTKYSRLSSSKMYAEAKYDYADNPYPLNLQLLPTHREEIGKFLIALNKFSKSIKQPDIDWSESGYV